MDNVENATEAKDQAIAPGQEAGVPALTAEDPESLIKALEEKQARLVEEKENYKNAYFKERSKNKEYKGEIDPDETEEERVNRIVEQKLADSKISEIDRQKEEILQRVLKENRELKLAQANGTRTPPAAVGSHSESQQVSDTLVTPEQLAHFRAMGKDEKWIENYKRNLKKGSGR